MSKSEVVAPVSTPVKPSKVVTFRWSDGRWDVDTQVSDSKFPITERDFNQLTTLLTVKRLQLRKTAYLQYLKLQREENTKKSVSPATQPVAVLSK